MSEKYEKIYSANAERGTKYGGRRFLGITPKGKEVWSTMEFDRSSKVLDLNLGKGFKDLYDEQAFLSPVRIQIKLSQTKPKNLQHQFKIIKKKTAGGEVTHRTLQYLEKLKSAVDAKQSKSHVNEVPTKLLFQYVASMIYTGDLNENAGFRWSDVTNLWGLPSGEYFIIDSFPKGEDN
tara:strand:- start:506 stop:1039 length:534 start_codon:yes stop_codon:yes gene_type:complete